MSWFDEQIRQRMKSDKTAVEKSFDQLAGAVLGEKWSAELEDRFSVARQSLDEVLQFYHCRSVEIPDDITNFDEQMEYLLRPVGIMTRPIKLTEGWYKDAIGPLLGFFKESGMTVALLPHPFFGYRFKDPTTGRYIRINRKTAQLFDEDAVCFYKPLPQKKLGIPDLLKYMKGCLSGGDYVLIIIATLVVVLISMLEPYVAKFVTGPVLNSGELRILASTGIFLVAVMISAQLLGVVRSILMNRVNTKTSIQVESAVMMRVLSLPVSFFRKYSSGDLASRVGSVNALCNLMISQIMSISLTSLASILYIVQIVSFSPALLVPSIIIILTTVIFGAIVSFAQIKRSEKIMNLNAKETGLSYATVSGIQKIRLAGAEKRAFARWANLYSKSAEMQYNPPLYLKLNGVFLTAISLIGNIILYYIAVRAGITESTYYAFTISYGQVMGAFTALASIATSIATFRPLLHMAEPILKSEPEINEEKELLTSVNGDIELEHVYFRYDERRPFVLSDLSLKVKAGEYIAIVGRTGCGKSTLVRLLLGFEKPAKGAVFYDHKDLSQIDPRSLRRKLGVVTQNGKLFPGDIYSNIVITAPQLTVDDAWEAAEIAGIADDIREMPMGMNTVVFEGQGGVSGGQKQRLMIARAVVSKPNILIFDEATSALDNITQKKVADALDKLKCTRIVIAHRLSTIRNCDRILVMEDGKFVEDGTYDELIAKCGYFAELVERQRLDKEEK